jgi:hypothetical protein
MNNIIYVLIVALVIVGVYIYMNSHGIVVF